MMFERKDERWFRSYDPLFFDQDGHHVVFRRPWRGWLILQVVYLRTADAILAAVRMANGRHTNASLEVLPSGQ